MRNTLTAGGKKIEERRIQYMSFQLRIKSPQAQELASKDHHFSQLFFQELQMNGVSGSRAAALPQCIHLD